VKGCGPEILFAYGLANPKVRLMLLQLKSNCHTINNMLVTSRNYEIIVNIGAESQIFEGNRQKTVSIYSLDI